MQINQFDVIIIGAGPAGLIAAIESYKPAKKIVILEKMPRPALKLKITGKGRCNITNNAELREFISHFGDNGRFLKYAFSEFFNKELLQYFEQYGVKFKLERGQRYFPESDNAMQIANVLLEQVRLRKIPILTDSKVTRISKSSEDQFTVSIGTETLKSKIVLIATGGKSYPRTGSTGDGYKFAELLGHTITPPMPSLVPVKTAGDTAKKLQGLSLKNVNVKVIVNNKKVEEEFGEMLFTDIGVSGPIILTLSKIIVSLVDNNQEITISIDLKPALDHKQLDKRLLREIKDHGKQEFKTLLKSLLPRKLIAVLIEQLQIPEDKIVSELNAQERKNLRNLLKEFNLQVTGYCSYEEAIVTAGGVSISEINPQTMESKLVNGLYFAGEVIDINGDTGGFNLQAAFSTGWVAGRAIKEVL